MDKNDRNAQNSGDKDGKVKSPYCERFARLMKAYAPTQRKFSEMTGIKVDTVTLMKQRENILMLHLPDIAAHLPGFDFRFLFYGELNTTDTIRARRLIEKALELI